MRCDELLGTAGSRFCLERGFELGPSWEERAAPEILNMR
ncbi:hypothetical protein PLANPX_1226 [Lacipirellula parvula]|uniref:Uncharacterized protein n=1 Tax=Lacipirellula parvula TaxID=2650471 RepID=A0A5K7X4J9_9BACT|nr:hypothetical protein PLANPX_1226 [Lacipirellula parvula]